MAHPSLYCIVTLASSPVSISCGHPGSVAYGNVIFTDSSVGAKARIECNAGFWLIGISERICQANGRWSGILPTCEGIYTTFNCGFFIALLLQQ